MLVYKTFETLNTISRQTGEIKVIREIKKIKIPLNQTIVKTQTRVRKRRGHNLSHKKTISYVHHVFLGWTFKLGVINPFSEAWNAKCILTMHCPVHGYKLILATLKLSLHQIEQLTEGTSIDHWTMLDFTKIMFLLLVLFVALVISQGKRIFYNLTIILI